MFDREGPEYIPGYIQMIRHDARYSCFGCRYHNHQMTHSGGLMGRAEYSDTCSHDDAWGEKKDFWRGVERNLPWGDFTTGHPTPEWCPVMANRVPKLTGSGAFGEIWEPYVRSD